MKNRLLTSVVTAVSLLTLAACADMKVTPVAAVPEGRVLTADGQLLDLVRFEMSMAGVKGVTATAANGEITLKGNVETGQELVKVAKLVQNVPGVRAVIPDIDVKR